MILATYIVLAVIGGGALLSDLNSSEYEDSLKPNNTEWRRVVIKLCLVCLTALTCTNIVAGALTS
jgi:hypothetical protein